MEKRLLCASDAASLLPKGKQVHTFRNPGGMMIGADWSRKAILDLFNEHDGKIEIGGDTCRSLGHALVVWTDNTSPLFIENDKEKLEAFDPCTNKS